jgi:hypothetical protein
MIHAVIAMERMTKTPIAIHTKMMSNLALSSLSDAHNSMALKIRRIAIPNPQNWSGLSHRAAHPT